MSIASHRENCALAFLRYFIFASSICICHVWLAWDLRVNESVRFVANIFFWSTKFQIIVQYNFFFVSFWLAITMFCNPLHTKSNFFDDFRYGMHICTRTEWQIEHTFCYTLLNRFTRAEPFAYWITRQSSLKCDNWTTTTTAKKEEKINIKLINFNSMW